MQRFNPSCSVASAVIANVYEMKPPGHASHSLSNYEPVITLIIGKPLRTLINVYTGCYINSITFQSMCTFANLKAYFVAQTPLRFLLLLLYFTFS